MYDTAHIRPTATRRALTMAEIEARAHIARSETAHSMLRALRRALVGRR
ncbi:hypothetical protein [Pontivivens insulae]|uniref:Uncharacterized protein n=1 Tax=Pontivivens insulae TaxID=1639689 RepID=A0A2R8A9A1_9RHOB|nr:hypothetical protein [Pontivivens insulae]RED12713.1 hypothetical protein DFR53_1842 [Pontivivens insulae]SPF28804.1 hypothetical protein POI8812_01107 [Pontivivens insulae]